MKKPVVLNKRLKRINRELNAVSSDLKSLETRPSGGGAAPPRKPAATASRTRERRPAREPEKAPQEDSNSATPNAKLRDERFTDYLATSFQSSRPLKYEKKIQRNRAVFMAVIVVLALLWLISKLWM